MITPEVIGKNLRNICQEKNISYQEVIENSGIAVSTFYDILSGHGNPRISTLQDICNALNISMIDLFVGKNSDISEL